MLAWLRSLFRELLKKNFFDWDNAHSIVVWEMHLIGREPLLTLRRQAFAPTPEHRADRARFKNLALWGETVWTLHHAPHARTATTTANRMTWTVISMTCAPIEVPLCARSN